MSVARKLAGITKDNTGYKTLESRFGMFLASNTDGEVFSIQCVAVAKTSPMELTSDPYPYDSIKDVLRNGSHSSASTHKDSTAVEDKNQQQQRPMEERNGRLSMEVEGYHRSEPTDELSKMTGSNTQDQGMRHTAATNRSPPNMTPLDENNGSVSSRWVKSAAIVKLAYRKYKPIVMDHVSQTGTLLKELSTSGTQGGSSPRANSPVSGSTLERDFKDSPPSFGNTRTESTNSVMTQSDTHYADLGHGSFPTVQICSQPSGHFDGTLRITNEDITAYQEQEKSDGQHGTGKTHPRFLKVCAYHPEMREHCHSTVNLIDPEGISIISDIDDTIKDTQVTAGARIVLRNTFLREMQEVHGMSDVYNGWWKQGAVFHYVSNSPWQLIPTLLDFFDAHKFPRGSAHLRLHDSVLKTYFTPPDEHKMKTIREIVRDFPKRKFILVGDSGELDMEILTTIASEFPEQVVKVFIRDITSGQIQKPEAKSTNIPGDNPPSYEDTQAQQHQATPSPHRPDPTLSPASSSPSTQRSTESSTGLNGCPFDELMPGGPPPVSEPPTVALKTPYEMWEERIENCRKKVAKDVLSLFLDAEELKHDQKVNDELQAYKGTSDCIDEKEESNEKDPNRLYQQADHIIHQTVETLEEKLHIGRH